MTDKNLHAWNYEGREGYIADATHKKPKLIQRGIATNLKARQLRGKIDNYAMTGVSKFDYIAANHFSTRKQNVHDRMSSPWWWSYEHPLLFWRGIWGYRSGCCPWCPLVCLHGRLAVPPVMHGKERFLLHCHTWLYVCHVTHGLVLILHPPCL